MNKWHLINGEGDQIEVDSSEMNDEKYVVRQDGTYTSGIFDNIVDAMIFAEALFNHYYNEKNMKVTIERQPVDDKSKNEDR